MNDMEKTFFTHQSGRWWTIGTITIHVRDVWMQGDDGWWLMGKPWWQSKAPSYIQHPLCSKHQCQIALTLLWPLSKKTKCQNPKMACPLLGMQVNCTFYLCIDVTRIYKHSNLIKSNVNHPVMFWQVQNKFPKMELVDALFWNISW